MVTPGLIPSYVQPSLLQYYSINYNIVCIRIKQL